MPRHLQICAVALCIAVLSPSTRAATVREDASLAGDLMAGNLIGMEVRNAVGDDIGRVEDLIIDVEYRVREAVLDVGGFLGIDDKLVAVPYESLRIFREGRTLFVAYDSTESALEANPTFEYAPDHDDAWRATDLIGDDVLSTYGGTLGRLEDLVLAPDDTVARAVLSIGSLLGGDAKRVAVPYDRLSIGYDGQGDELMYDATTDELEALPAFTPPDEI